MLRRRHPGFTLVEMLVVMAIIGLLAAMAVTAVMYGTRRARARNVLFEVTSLFPLARGRAVGMARPQYVALWEQGGAFGAAVLDLPAHAAAPDWTDVDLTDPGSFGARAVESVDLSPDTGASVVPLTGAATLGLGIGTEKVLPAPFSSISLKTLGGGLLGACTFCIANKSGGAVGVVRFAPSGTVTFLTPLPVGAVTGGAISLGETGAAAGTNRIVAVAAPLGALKVY